MEYLLIVYKLLFFHRLSSALKLIIPAYASKGEGSPSAIPQSHHAYSSEYIFIISSLVVFVVATTVIQKTTFGLNIISLYTTQFEYCDLFVMCTLNIVSNDTRNVCIAI